MQDNLGNPRVPYKGAIERMKRKSGNVHVPDFCVPLVYANLLEVRPSELYDMNAEDFWVQVGWAEGKILAQNVNGMEQQSASHRGGLDAQMKR